MLFVRKKVYEDLKEAYLSSIAAKNEVIEAYKREVENLENRIAYHKAKAERRAAYTSDRHTGKRYNKSPYVQPTTTISELDSKASDQDITYPKNPK